MKKLSILLLFVFAIASINTNAQTKSTVPPILSEGFDGTTFPPTGWTRNPINPPGHIWTRVTESIVVHRGAGATGVNNQGGNASIPPTHLITPQLAIPNDDGTYILEFWSLVHYFGSPTPAKEYSVLLSTTNTALASFTKIFELTAEHISSTYHKIIIPLDEYKGESIYIAFKYEKGTVQFPNSWYIDDVLVYDVSRRVDVAMTEIITPISGINLTDAEEVTVIVTNNGGRVAQNIKMDLYLGAGEDIELIATEYITSIPTQSDFEFTFLTETLDLSAEALYDITVVATIADDADNSNDTIRKRVRNIICDVIDVTDGWFEDFETFTHQSSIPPRCWSYYGDYSHDGRPYWAFANKGGEVENTMLRHETGWFGHIETWLVMPAFEIPEDGNFFLQFITTNRISQDYNGQELCEIYISTTGRNPEIEDVFTNVLTLDRILNWQTISISLEEFAGETIYVAFKYSGHLGYTWYIDDVAVLELDYYTVTIETPTNGSITVKDGNTTITNGMEVIESTTLTLTAEPATGYEFDKWMDGNTNPSRTLTLTQDTTISATFARVKHIVTIPNPTNGTVLVTYTTTTKETITVNSGDQVEHGTTLTLTATANNNYEFEKWWNESVNNPQLYLLEAPESISATFKAKETSIVETNNYSSLQVFPNPVKDVLNIETEETIKQIFVLDINGRIVMQVNGNNKTINLQDLPAGNYVVRIHTETAVVSERIIKQ